MLLVCHSRQQAKTAPLQLQLCKSAVQDADVFLPTPLFLLLQAEIALARLAADFHECIQLSWRRGKLSVSLSVNDAGILRLEHDGRLFSASVPDSGFTSELGANVKSPDQRVPGILDLTLS